MPPFDFDRYFAGRWDFEWDVQMSPLGADGPAFQLVFAIEAAAFVLAALLAVRATGGAALREARTEQREGVYA